MEPVAGELGARGGFALGDLVFVVGKDEIPAADVDVDGLAEVGHAHRRALDVPARSSLAPRRLEHPTFGRLVGGFDALVAVCSDRFGGRSAGLPEREVRRVTFLGAFVGIVLCFDPLDPLVRELAVPFELGDVEVHRSARLVGVVSCDQRLDQLDHLGNVFGDPGIDRRAPEIESAHGRERIADVRPGDLLLALTETVLPDPRDDLLVHVGKVLDVTDVVAQMGEPAGHHVDVDPRACVTEMGRIGDREATVVEQNFLRVAWLERPFLAGQRVGHAQRHGSISAGRDT